MRTHGIVGHRPRRRRRLTRPDTAAAPAPDLLGRLFDPDRPDVTWCGDITYIPTDQGWLYLASVIDLASRQLGHPGRALRRRPRPQPLVVRMVKVWLAARRWS
jgi:transposase InsO family protein